MPQFDSFSFFSQIFWLFAVIFLLFFVSSKNLIPAVSGTIKLRLKKLNFDFLNISKFNDEKKSLLLFLSYFEEKTFFIFSNILILLIKTISFWFSLCFSSRKNDKKVRILFLLYAFFYNKPNKKTLF